MSAEGCSRMFHLDGHRAAVTGAASGIGHAVTCALLAQGAEVLLIDRDPALLKQAMQDLAPDQQARAHASLADITDADRLKELLTGFGPLDAIFANAGISGGPGFGTPAGQESGVLERQSMDHWRQVLDVNLMGTVQTLQAALPVLRRGGGGRMVVTASVAGLQAEPFVSYAYAMAKTAVVRLVQQTALELAPQGITVNAIAPGFIRTGIADGRLHDPQTSASLQRLIPLGRLGNPSDLGGLAAFLASRSSDYITGAVIPVDGGYLLNPKGHLTC